MDRVFQLTLAALSFAEFIYPETGPGFDGRIFVTVEKSQRHCLISRIRHSTTRMQSFNVFFFRLHVAYRYIQLFTSFSSNQVIMAVGISNDVVI